jgi:hypothetical protein
MGSLQDPRACQRRPRARAAADENEPLVEPADAFDEAPAAPPHEPLRRPRVEEHPVHGRVS